MRVAYLTALALGVLDCTVRAEPALDLKPGFYSDEDPESERLNDLWKKSDVHIDLSGHAGISFGNEADLTLEELKVALKTIEKKELARVLLQKNYTDEFLHVKVEKLLLEEGFKGILIVRAHSSLTILVKFTTNSEQGDAVQPATAVDSEVEGKEKAKPESEARSQ